ncbi:MULTISPECIES: XRE family transcriptional regulator [unclassified Streptomyces]|uniref:helix-turn-helix domain-containing protein n=1 Tax=unclassified Streptomyces TaxID=2593676 RepID=UPI002DD9BCB8|nr:MULTISPECIES: XRE family transcriptional regulator [unclassified Streptomyces]WSA97511.1 XRE family transcriptional regulator [Streptomyces sp. NBC_01795]WSB81938.1 XRE family transcriptional regulator [Streptomyces sp. NBC_01775]WSS17303.1 XRE family transcriptional regulator [Streptomyces sp. NBC_01186]WSS46045.1 XRE family transcriptional regulator [Streptomyces sp. NBC_01187]
MTDLDHLTQALARNLKRFRTERGFTLDALAARACVSRGMLIQIEQARTNPSVGTVVKVADALGISITSLLDFDRAPHVRLVPPEQAIRLWSTEAGSHGTLLTGTEAPGPLELWSWKLMPGEGHSSDPHPQGTTELLHVAAGTLTLTVDGADHHIEAGTSACFASHLPHGYRNDGTETVELSMAVSVPEPR